MKLLTEKDKKLLKREILFLENELYVLKNEIKNSNAIYVQHIPQKEIKKYNLIIKKVNAIKVGLNSLKKILTKILINKKK